MKKILFLIAIIFSVGGMLIAQNLHSVNVPGDRLDGFNSMAVMDYGGDSLAIAGTSEELAIHFFNFDRGTTRRTLIKQQLTAQVLAPVRGAAATTTEQDSAWILSGMLEQEEDVFFPFVMKCARNGQVLWAVQMNTITHSVPQKVHALSDGSVLLSMLTNAEENALGNIAGEWVLVKLSAQGSVEWTFKAALGQDETSFEAGIHELPSSELICIYSKGVQTGLVKLTANGNVLTHRLMEPGWTAKHSTLNPHSREVFMVGTDQIWKTDSALNLVQGIQINNQALQGIHTVRYVNDSMLAMGGVHQNQAIILHYNPITGQIENANQRALSVISSRTLGLFELNQNIYSLTASGMAFTQHQANLDADCFNKINPSLLSTQSLMINPMGSGQEIQPQYTTTLLNNLVAQDSVELQPSANCIEYDLSVRPPQLLYENTCQNVVMPWFVFNHGTQTINRFSLTYYWNNTQVSQTFTGMSIAPKTGRLIEFGTPYLNPGLNTLGIRVWGPNGMEDEFPFNDSLFVTYQTGSTTSVNITFLDSLCSNQEQEIVLRGPENGTFALFRDSVLTMQSSQGRFTLAHGNSFYGRFTSERGCIFFSDTVFPTVLQAPDIPTIEQKTDSLFTNAPFPNTWFLFSSPIAENTKSIPILEQGMYSVQTTAENGCTEVSNPFNANMHSTVVPQMQNPLFVYNNTLMNPLKLDYEYWIYSIDGKRIAQGWVGGSPQQHVNLTPGIYLLRYTINNQHYSLKFVAQ